MKSRLFYPFAVACGLLAGTTLSANAYTFNMNDSVTTAGGTIDQTMLFTVTGKGEFFSVDSADSGQGNWGSFSVFVNTTPNPASSLINFTFNPVGPLKGNSISGSGELGPGSYYVTVEGAAPSRFPEGFHSSSYTANFSVSATPLPPAWTLMLVGLAGVGFMFHRRGRTEGFVANAAAA